MSAAPIHPVAGPERAARSALIVACLAYVTIGVVSAVLGPALPEIAERVGSDLAAVGAVFTTLFLGGLLAQLTAGPATDHLGHRPVLLGGLLLLIGGLLAILQAHTLSIFLLAGGIAGYGHGSVDIGCNLLVAWHYVKKNVSALNLLHVFFGIGAVAGPLAVSISVVLRGTAMPAIWLAIGLCILTLLPVALVLGNLPRHARTDAATRSSSRLYLAPLLWIFAAFLLVYVGVEMGMSGWTTAYMGETAGLPVQTAALVTSGYWLALTTGRLLSALWGDRLTALGLVALDLTGATIAAFALVLAGNNGAAAIAATLLMGLSFGSIYPTVVAIVTADFRANQGKAAGVVTAAGSLGGMILPWLQGILLVRRGPEASVQLVAAGVLAMCVLLAVAWLVGARQQAATTNPAVAVDPAPGIDEVM